MSVFGFILVRIQSKYRKIRTGITLNTDTFYVVELLKFFEIKFDTSLEIIGSHVTRYFSLQAIKTNDFICFTNSGRFEAKNMIAPKQYLVLLILGEDKNIPNILICQLNLNEYF